MAKASKLAWVAASPLLVAFQQAEGPAIPWWVWLTVILVALLVFMIVLVLQQRPGPPLPKQEAVHHVVPAAPPDGDGRAPAADDLQRIVGIGPREAAVLAAAGVTTFAGLADADPLWLEELLDGAGLKLARPDSWLMQAKLAADGRWPEFENLVARLQDERR